jgi:hypothetical protein
VRRYLWVFLSSLLWVSWAVPVYTTCVPRGALHFFNKIFLLLYIYYILNKRIGFQT